MPNMKIYADERMARALIDDPDALLGEIRALLCQALSVPAGACQLAVVPIRGLRDQPSINVELMILPRDDRTRELLTDLAAQVRNRLTDATGLQTAVRIAHLDPQTYVALK